MITPTPIAPPPEELAISLKFAGLESVLILETRPAAYLTLAANEALKAADIKLISIRPFGATGRLVMAGTESEIDSGAAAALKSLAGLNESLDALGGGKKASR